MISLQAGRLRLDLAPETGGAIAAFTAGGEAVLRPVRDARLAAQNGQAVAAYPLIPFANRVAWGRFSWAGQEYTLARNFGDHPHPLHGNAWMRPWAVVASGADHASLTLAHDPQRDGATHWPFAYGAWQDFTLSPSGLDLRIGLRNTAAAAWPAGLGLHPYVARASETRLGFDADTVWLNGADSLPVSREAVSHAWDFTGGRALDGTVIDNCYAGWGGNASITWPGRGATLRLETSAPFDHLQIYTPAGADYLGLEPVSNMPDAINRLETTSDSGLKILAPGEVLEGVVRFIVA